MWSAAPGTERVEVAEGFFASLWTEVGGEPVRYVAHTAERVFTHENGETTSRPR